MLLRRDPLAGLLQLAPSPAIRSLFAEQKRATRGYHRFRAWLASRRSGKSYAAAVWLLGGKKGELSIYCARTLKSAKGIMMAVFAELNAKYHLNLDIRTSTGTITEPNGHVIQLYGLRDKGTVDLLRGLSKLRKVYVDEMGAFDDELARYSIESVLQPMLLDLQGLMCVAGTPGPIPKGYWYDLSGNPGLENPIKGRWPTSYWTYEQNPHIPASMVLAEALEVNGWTAQSPGFAREYRAIWCEDLDAIIYRYEGRKWEEPPATGLTVMVMDFGVVDQTAFVVGRQGYETRPHLHLIKGYAKSHMDLPEIAERAREFRERYAVNRIYADEGALGKGYANTLRNQYRLPIEPIPKQHKRAKIDGVRGRLAAGTLHICLEAQSIHDEWMSLTWNETRDDHHPRQLDDLSDAVCYLCATPEFSAYEAPIVVTPQETEWALIKQRASEKAMRGRGLGDL